MAPSRFSVASTLLTLCLLAAPCRTWAEGVAVPLPELTSAQGSLERGDFDEAIQTLGRGLERPDLSDAQLVELYRLLGLAHLYLGHEDQAREAYEKLLQAMPDYELPRRTPPKVQQLYARIKADIKKRRVRPVTLKVTPVDTVEGDRPVQVRAAIQDLALGSKPKLFYRRAGGQAFSSVEFLKDRNAAEQFIATVPAYELRSEATGYDLEYYVEVTDAAQRRLAGRGDVDQPMRFHVRGKQDVAATVAAGTPWYKSPWFWVGAGVVVAGATAGTIVLLNQKPDTSLSFNIHVNPSP